MDVLVVDPTELGELLVVLLQQQDYVAGHARTAERALESAVLDPPHVVVIEAELEDAHGLDLAELLQAELPCKVILTHALHLRHDAANAARMKKCDRIFARPYNSVELVRAVAALLGREIPLLAQDDEVATSLSGDGDVIDVDDVTIDFDDVIGVEMVQQQQAQQVEPSAVSIPKTNTPPADKDALSNAFHVMRASGAALPLEPPTSVGILQPRILYELLNAYHQAALHGELRVDHEGIRRVLRFRKGKLAGARSSAVDEDLLHLMMQRKAIDEEAAMAIADAVSSGAFRSIAEAALALDATTEMALHAVLEEHARKVALGAFYATGARFHAQVSAQSSAHDGLDVNLHIGDVLLHLFLRGESEDALLRAADDSVRFQPQPDAAYGLEQLKLSSQEARVVVAMDGSKTIGDLRLLFDHMPARTIRGVAAALHTLGLVRIAGHGPATAKRIRFF
jgi:DNA-binding NarL/FixJ family response regulator